MERKAYSAGAVKMSFWFIEFRKVVQLLHDGNSIDEISFRPCPGKGNIHCRYSCIAYLSAAQPLASAYRSSCKECRLLCVLLALIP